MKIYSFIIIYYFNLIEKDFPYSKARAIKATAIYIENDKKAHFRTKYRILTDMIEHRN